MRLVGASNLNIKIPFVFEGLFLGIIGSIIPIALMIYSYSWVYEKLKDENTVVLVQTAPAVRAGLGEAFGLPKLDNATDVFMEYISFFHGGCRSQLRHFFR